MKDYIQFPDPNYADNDGLVAIGGNLNIETILSAYIQGIFPWYNEDSQILWWSPNPRMVMIPQKFHLSKNLARTIKKNIFQIDTDHHFNEVIEACASVKRKNQSGTWITEEMKKAYKKLFGLGFAHSVESYVENRLVGGLYGVAIGKVFFGESMFYYKTDASKVALYYLIKLLKEGGYELLDVQQSTNHLKSLGAENMERKEFLQRLQKNVYEKPNKNVWSNNIHHTLKIKSSI